MKSTRYTVLCTCIKYIATLAACILTGNLYAQRFPFHNLSVDDGLIQSQATCLAQDKTGNLWIGTLGGLSCYDGRDFTNYTVRNGLQSNVIMALATDSLNNIWISSTTGISRFNGKKFVYYTLPGSASRSQPGSQQISIIGDTTWWRTQGAIYFIANGHISYYATPGTDAAASAMLAEKNGLWVAKQGIIYHCSFNKNKIWDTISFNLQPDQVLPSITHLFRANDTLMWVTTNTGLYKIDHGHIVAHTINNEPLSSFATIFSITQDKSGALWLGTTSGAYKLMGNTLQPYNKHNGLSDNRFFDMLTDAEGNVWMASDGQGIFRFSGTQFTGLDETMGLPSAQIMSVAAKHDSLFLATYDAGLYVFNNGKISSLQFPAAPMPVISCLLYTRSKLWIGTIGAGLWSYQHGIYRQYATPERDFPSNNISSLYEDTSGRLWIGFNNGIVILDTEKFSIVPDKKLSVISFLAIGADSTLIATESNGLQLYSAGVLSDFITHTIADSAAIKCFTLAGRDIWMGSSDNGVIRYNMDSHKALAINKSNGLRSDFIYNIIGDNEQNIWVGTGYGIHKIKMNFHDEPQVTFYGKSQGITGMESNSNAVIKLPDGSIWFGTTNGALHYQPHTAVVSSAPASIILVSVTVAGENKISPDYFDSTGNWYGIPYHLRLPWQKNNISFSYQAVTLSGEQQVLYRYRMDGLETPWSDWSTTNSVTYPALPPGKYVFRAQCRGADGRDAPELAYSFEIITPFQKTNWFRLAILFACILSGITLQYIISSRKQRRLALLDKLRDEEQTKIRIRTAEDFHDEIGNKLTRINVLTNVLKSKIPPAPDTTRILTQIEENTGQLYGGTRDILWSLQPANDNLYEILYRIRDFGNELFQDTDVAFTFTGDDEKWSQYRLPMDMSRNLIMIFKEALNNCLKYGHAKNVSITVKWKSKGVLQLVLRDDGQGFDLRTVEKGNGINNMHIRTERIHGKLYIDSGRNKGTITNLTFKIPQKRG